MIIKIIRKDGGIQKVVTTENNLKEIFLSLEDERFKVSVYDIDTASLVQTAIIDTSEFIPFLRPFLKKNNYFVKVKKYSPKMAATSVIVTPTGEKVTVSDEVYHRIKNLLILLGKQVNNDPLQIQKEDFPVVKELLQSSFPMLKEETKTSTSTEFKKEIFPSSISLPITVLIDRDILFLFADVLAKKIFSEKLKEDEKEEKKEKEEEKKEEEKKVEEKKVLKDESLYETVFKQVTKTSSRAGFPSFISFLLQRKYGLSGHERLKIRKKVGRLQRANRLTPESITKYVTSLVPEIPYAECLRIVRDAFSFYEIRKGGER